MADYRCFHADDRAERAETMRGMGSREEAATTFALRNGGVPAYVVVEDLRGSRSSVSVSKRVMGGYDAFVT